MKITKKYLKKLIKEEVEKLLLEKPRPGSRGDWFQSRGDYDEWLAGYNDPMGHLDPSVKQRRSPRRTPSHQHGRAMEQRSNRPRDPGANYKSWLAKNAEREKYLRSMPTYGAAPYSPPTGKGSLKRARLRDAAEYEEFIRRNPHMAQYDMTKPKAPQAKPGSKLGQAAKFVGKHAAKAAGPVGAVAGALTPSSTARNQGFGVTYEEVKSNFPELDDAGIMKVVEYTGIRDSMVRKRMGMPKHSMVTALVGPRGQSIIDALLAKQQRLGLAGGH